MKRRKLKSIIAMMLAAVMTFSSIPAYTTVFAEEASSELAAETADVSIYPVPQSSVLNSEDGMLLNGTVDVVIHGAQDEATLPKLEALLAQEGIAYEMKDAVGENAAIVLATKCDDEACTVCNGITDAADALTKDQGYVLTSSNDVNPKGQITIVGAYADGAYYGVMTLYQLFAQKTADGHIAEVTVSDYPDVPFRGYVEGFYGIPWTFEDRANLFRDTTMYKMTTYIYAPKDDPYHRGSWRTLYPEAEAANIKALTEIAAENNMEFCWTIHPGADYDYTTDSDGNGLVDDYEAILAKFEQVYSLGVRQFGIFYDDLDYSVANGVQHATTINDAYAYLSEKYGDVKPCITVLTRYTNSWGANMNTYFKPFMELIHEDTIVLWTGQSTMSAITHAYMEWPQTQTGIDRDFGVWWNYPVNDYCDGHLLMSPLKCLSNDVDNICSFFLNPMSEAEASKVAIYSGADYSWNIADFDSQTSWSRAIEELIPEANEEFERFADNIGYVNKGNGFLFDESEYLIDEMEALKAAVSTKENLSEQVANMKARFAQMLTDAETLKNIQYAELLDEITHHLDAYKAIGNAGLSLMTAFECALNADVEGTINNLDQINGYLAEAETYKTPILNGSARAYVCTHRMIPFIRDMFDYVMDVLNYSFADQSSAKIVSNVIVPTDLIIAETSNGYQLNDIELAMNDGDYVGIRLPKTCNLYGAGFTGEPQDNFVLQYSLNGIEWMDLGDEIVTATYVRLLCTVDGTNGVIDNFYAAPSYEPIEPVATTNLPTYRTNVISNAIDGDLTNLFWSSTGTSDGSYIEVDLGAQALVNTIQLYSGVNKHGVVDAFPATQLEISDDGRTWTPVGDPKPLSDFVNMENDSLKRSILTIETGGVTTRYFRLTSVGASESWLMAYEIVHDAQYVDYDNRLDLTTEMDIYRTYTPEFAMDNDYSTYLWAYHRLEDGSEWGSYKDDYVQVDLGTVVPLYDATIYYGKNVKDTEFVIDGFYSTSLQVSLDGENWTPVGTSVPFDSYLTSNNLYAATVKGDGSLARYIRFVADEDYRSWIKVYEIEYNQSLDAIRNSTMAVSTNMKTYENYAIANIMDGDMNTKFYSSAATKENDYVQVDFGSVINLYDASIYYGGSPNSAATAIDGFGSTILQVSTDGSNWTQVGDEVVNTDYEVVGGRFYLEYQVDGISARYVRFTAGSAVKNWCQVYEVQFNKSVDGNAVRYTEGTAKINQSDYLNDGKLDTAPSIYEVDAGDTLIFPMTTVTNVDSISIYQERAFISNALVSIQKPDGTWAEIGTLGEAFNTFEINEQILALMFTFDGNVQPIIYEIIVTEVPEEEPANTLEIVAQPVDTSAGKGKEASVAVEVSGEDLTYTWYYKNPGNVKFYKSSNSYVSEDGATYTIPMYAWRDGQEVYCVITDANGNSVQTNTVTLQLSVDTSIVIVNQPQDGVFANGEMATISVEAEGIGLTYEWYYMNAGNVKFYKSGSQFVSEDGATYSIKMNRWRDGQQVYCIITDANGDTVQTNTVTISMPK